MKINYYYERIKPKDDVDKDDYQAQLCLSEYQPETSFLPETENYDEDFSGGNKQIEVKCSKCDAHLGLMFDDGPAPTYRRY